jgi:hypothetical protein
MVLWDDARAALARRLTAAGVPGPLSDRRSRENSRNDPTAGDVATIHASPSRADA